MLRGRRRDRFTIMAEILNIARNGTLKTRIMYGADLSFTQLNEYLSSLQEVKLLEVDTEDGKKIYETTSKGEKYLETFEELKACMHASGDPVNRSDLPSFSISKERQVFIVDD